MGKLIKFGRQEKRLARCKKLQCNRVLFLLGMILIGSSYHFLKNHWSMPKLWTTMYSQNPVKMASRDLSDSETVISNSDHQESILEMEDSTLHSQVTEGRDKLTTSATIAKKNLNTPRRIMDNSTPGTPETPRRRKKNYTPTTFSRNVQRPTSTTPKKIENHVIIPKVKEKINDTMTLRKTMEKKLLAIPKRTVKNIPRTPKGIVENTPTSLKRIIENTVSPSAKVVVQTTPTIPKRIKEKNPAVPKRVMENTSITSKRVVEKKNSNISKRRGAENSPTAHPTMMETSTVVPSTTVENTTSPGLGVMNTPTRARVWTSRTSSTRVMMKKTSSVTLREGAHNTTSSAMGIITPTAQIRDCVFVDHVPTVPVSLSPSTEMTPLSDEDSHSSPTDPKLLGFHPKGEYPEDLFSVEERKQGWVVLHLFGMIYVFVALAIVCDEFFVPALGVITDKLQISEDVAGATFMAAGGSAPELFTSLIGVFISHSNVGIGTIVGSAVFNILFVIGTCALFSKEVLNLTWWPLFRDVSFYIFDLMMLIIFFLDSMITWWESLMLLMAYGFYVFTMKWNQQLEIWVKEQLNKRTVPKIMIGIGLNKTGNGDIPVDDVEDSKKLKEGAAAAGEDKGEGEDKDKVLCGNEAGEKNEDEPQGQNKDEIQGKSQGQGREEEDKEGKKDHGKGDAERDEGGKEGVKEGEEKGEEEGEEGEEKGEEGEEEGEEKGEEEGEEKGEEEGEEEGEEKGEEEGEEEGEKGVEEGEEKGEEEGEEGEEKGEEKSEEKGEEESEEEGEDGSEDEDEDAEEDEEEEEEENEEPLTLEWPETKSKQAIYLFIFPIIFPLWLTIPDVRRPESKKFFVITFLGSILWIAMFSYLMVWWAHQVGETIGISEEIMGLTILAAGTSIPDLITSVIVARKGLGDMAVSSSVGSNIFDITVGLPVPWFLFSLLNALQPVPVSSNGLFCAIVLLFLMLLFVISSIAVCKWKMNKILGFIMFLLYFIFLIISVMLEDRIISCPISI
ncbi:sodium/potassium/calcium exchanger 1 [Antechinus flavipes]|uniref:sodium/potassium/calcium exchanger 1 n=1 Tax=Antechinus flavipes TaxID=38775 RepID=UPI002235FCEF|nr:sodium/potassium/calcium exchanger 1 [Antechinus flavipes]